MRNRRTLQARQFVYEYTREMRDKPGLQLKSTIIIQFADVRRGRRDHIDERENKKKSRKATRTFAVWRAEDIVGGGRAR